MVILTGFVPLIQAMKIPTHLQIKTSRTSLHHHILCLIIHINGQLLQIKYRTSQIKYSLVWHQTFRNTLLHYPLQKNSQSASVDDVQTQTSHPQMEVLADTDEEPFAGATRCRARMMWNEDDDIRLVSLISLSAWSYNHVSDHLFKIFCLNAD